MSYCQFRPTIRVTLDEGDGSVAYSVEWDEANEGMFDDDGDGIGWEGSEEHWDALQNIFRRVPGLLGYPTAYVDGRIVMSETNQEYGPAIKARVLIDPEEHAAQRAAQLLGKIRPTCAHYSPSKDAVAQGAVPLASWPFGQHFPYGVCTNPAVVGQGGFGPCRSDHPYRMSDCGAFVSEPMLRRGKTIHNDYDHILESGRGGQGQILWRLRSIHVSGEVAEQVQNFVGTEAESQARARWAELTDGAPVEAAPVHQAKRFIKSLVGACHGTEG